MERGKDICYGCSKVQENLTMADVTPSSFAIYCDDCHPAVAKLIDEVARIDKAIESHRDCIAGGGGEYHNKAIRELQEMVGKKEEQLKLMGYED